MSLFERSGYRSRAITTDIVLGLTNGLDMSLWCYVYASLIFAGALSVFLPVGILSILAGWILISTWVALTSKEPLHLAETDDQAVVIFGSISALMVSSMGDRAATSTGLVTLLAIIALTSLAFSAGCYLVGRYRLSRMLELLPFPVVCGFMASIGWLLLDAGFEIMGEANISFSVFSQLEESGRGIQLALSTALGAILLWLTNKLDKSWTLPAASLVLVLVYYLFMAFEGMSHADQQANGWLFSINESEGGVLAMLGALSPADIEWGFIASVIPQMLTIVFLAMLYASMTLTALKSNSPEDVSIADEFKTIGGGNLLCAAMCSPPGYTEVVGTSMYREFGASSRWFPLLTSFVGLAVAVLGGTLIGYLPKLLIGSTIFLFAFQMLYDWLHENIRDFGPFSYSIVFVILCTTIVFGFMTGIGVGIILTVLLFVMRYSMISAIHSRNTLINQRSSVERSNKDNEVLQKDGSQVVIYSLRGFLFFGTANTILDTIVEQEKIKHGKRKAFLLDMSRVTGLDISALIAFTQIMQACEAGDTLLVYSNVPSGIKEKLVAMHAVSEAGGEPLIFSEVDFAMEYLENLLLRLSGTKAQESNIRHFLLHMIDDEEKVDRLLQVMEARECPANEALFSQGDPDTGLYVVERGSLSAFIKTADGHKKRVRKFKPGALIGELSAYLKQKRRTATIIADENSVVYHLNFASIDKTDHELAATIHELVAATLAERVNFMNSRLGGSI
jgi:SulP family sulfate permease